MGRDTQGMDEGERGKKKAALAGMSTGTSESAGVLVGQNNYLVTPVLVT